MQVAHVLTRGATAPIRLGLAAGELGLSVVRSAVGEVRRAVVGEESPRADGWRRPRPPRVWSPGPEVREAADSAPAVPKPVQAGAEVHIDVPWDGYDAMTAIQIQERLASADSALAAAVVLYEGAGRRRVSVVGAADRRLRTLDS